MRAYYFYYACIINYFFIFLINPSCMIRDSQKDSLKRRVQVYPSWYYRKLVVAYSFMKQQSLGDTVEDANKSFFDSLSDDEKEKLLAVYEGLSEAERTHPKRARPKRFDE